MLVDALSKIQWLIEVDPNIGLVFDDFVVLDFLK